MNRTNRIALAALAAAALLSGCDHPLPPEKASYAGDWQAPVMTLHIAPEGRVLYKRTSSNSSTSVDGPIKGFEGDNLVVGFGPFTTTFVVSAPPHAVGEAWKMTVDGVELTRQP